MGGGALSNMYPLLKQRLIVTLIYGIFWGFPFCGQIWAYLGTRGHGLVKPKLLLSVSPVRWTIFSKWNFKEKISICRLLPVPDWACRWSQSNASRERTSARNRLTWPKPVHQSRKPAVPCSSGISVIGSSTSQAHKGSPGHGLGALELVSLRSHCWLSVYLLGASCFVSESNPLLLLLFACTSSVLCLTPKVEITGNTIETKKS